MKRETLVLSQIAMIPSVRALWMIKIAEFRNVTKKILIVMKWRTE